MFQAVRRITLKLHRWVALAVSVLVILVAGSGAILVFENEIDRALNPGLSYVTPSGAALPLATLVDNARRAFPKLRPLTAFLPGEPGLSAFMVMSDGTRVSIDPYSGRILGSRHITETFVNKVHQFHTRLLIQPAPQKAAPGQPARPSRLGNEIVGWTTVALLFLTVTGLVVWFPRMAFGLTRGARWVRFNLDLHNVSGIYALLFAVILAGTGVVIGFQAPGEMIRSVTSTPPPPRPPQVTLEKGRPMISPDEALAVATAAVPDAAPVYVVQPGPPFWTYVVSMRFPEDATPGGRSQIVVHPYTGEVLLRATSREAPLGTRIMNAMRPWHTGDVFGWPSRVVMFLASIAIVVQALTGFVVWAARTFKRKSASDAVTQG